MLFIFFRKEMSNIGNIAFPFVILTSQNDIQRNKLWHLESQNLDHFHGIAGKKH